MSPVVPFAPYPRDRASPGPAGNAVLERIRIGNTRIALPRFNSPRAQAGFPSPAADYVEDGIDLNDLLIHNPPATFFVRIAGDSLADAGVLDGDIASIDRSITPRPGQIVVVAYDGSIFIKRLRKVGGRLALCSENQRRATDYPPLFLDEAQDHTIWGVATGVVRKF